MVLVDSSVWIESLRRTGRLEVKVALEALLEAYEAQFCPPIRLEVLGGARKEDRRRLEYTVVGRRHCLDCPSRWNKTIYHRCPL